MINHFKETLPILERQLANNLECQCLDENSPDYGVIPNVNNGYTEPTSGVGLAGFFITGYYTPGTKYYHDIELLKRAKLAMAFTLARVHSDGTLDLMETNFHDSTVCGFAMHGAGPVCRLIKRFNAHTPEEDELEEMFVSFATSSGEAMTNCGFHTPNHRWVVSSALSYCYNLIGDERFLAHLNKFLAEGIDCDENGEYTERSAGTYNIICNRSLLILAAELNMPELLDDVTRNLYMVMKYFEPDETMNTMNSTRQDFGSDPDYSCYYTNYIEAALATGNTDFAWLADRMMSQNLGKFAAGQSAFCGPIIPFLMDPSLETKMLSIQTTKPSFEYEKHFVDSGIMRKRIGDATLTLVKDRPLFAKLQYGDKKMLVRFAGSFFGPHAQFIGQTLTPTEGGYRLTYHKTWGYKRPLEQPQGTSDWRKMDHTKRADVCMQDFDVAFDFVMKDGRLDITVDAGGCDNIPLKLELIFNAGGVYSTEATELITRPGDYVFLKKGKASYTFTDHCKFTVDGGFNEHHYGKNMRGAIPGDEKGCSIVMTGYTPTTKTVKISWGKTNLE